MYHLNMYGLFCVVLKLQKTQAIIETSQALKLSDLDEVESINKAGTLRLFTEMMAAMEGIEIPVTLMACSTGKRYYQ